MSRRIFISRQHSTESDFEFPSMTKVFMKSSLFIILGDPGAVSRVGRKGATKVFKYGRKSPWVPTLTKLFPEIQADAGPD